MALEERVAEIIVEQLGVSRNEVVVEAVVRAQPKFQDLAKDIEIKIIQSIEKVDLLTSDELNSLHDFYSNRYNSEFKELTSPPPEQNIL